MRYLRSKVSENNCGAALNSNVNIFIYTSGCETNGGPRPPEIEPGPRNYSTVLIHMNKYSRWKMDTTNFLSQYYKCNPKTKVQLVDQYDSILIMGNVYDPHDIESEVTACLAFVAAVASLNQTMEFPWLSSRYRPNAQNSKARLSNLFLIGLPGQSKIWVW